MNWHKTSLEDLDLLQKCALNNGFFANNYSAVNSVLYAQKYDSEIAIESDWIYEKYFDEGKLVFSFPHNINGEKQNIKAAVETLLNETSAAAGKGNESGTCIFRNITADEKDFLSANYKALSVEEAPDLSDYIYLTENLSNLAGKKYSRKRNHIKQFCKKYGTFTFEPLNPGNLGTAFEIEEKWFSENTADAQKSSFTEDLQKEREIIRTAFEHYDYFAEHAGMTGGILFIGTEPAAFCLASVLSPTVTDIHFEKCLSEFARDGGYAIINNEFAKTVSTTYINREEDLGIEGLRKSKLSYYPEIILEKYNVVINL